MEEIVGRKENIGCFTVEADEKRKKSFRQIFFRKYWKFSTGCGEDGLPASSQFLPQAAATSLSAKITVSQVFVKFSSCYHFNGSGHLSLKFCIV